MNGVRDSGPELLHSGPRDGPGPVTVIVGVLAAREASTPDVLDALTRQYGAVDRSGATVRFDRTRYYTAEMGPDLSRTFYSFSRLADANALSRMKNEAFRIERQFGREGKRQVNLDPGFIDGGKVVLASFKPGPQKIYLGHQVWADLIAWCCRGRLDPMPWAFPDLRDGPHLEFFERVRQHHKQRLRRRSR